MTKLSAARIREILNLEPHPIEGGYFVRTYASSHQLPQNALPPGYSGPRHVGTAIYYLLTPETFSALHRLPGDEIFHFYQGDPVELLELRPDGTSTRILLGHDLAAGMRPQHVVPAGVWQGSRLVSGGEYALLGTTMAPGFDYADYETGSRDQLISGYPDEVDRIRALTR
ncbi:MAG TPA: cupin domain-containing protein [Candidatus Acidoferrales bacterium]|jgi:hypothetical protein|nr:cupin domain-containing protein [Candidatus Acidoferrales bacterium]